MVSFKQTIVRFVSICIAANALCEVDCWRQRNDVILLPSKPRNNQNKISDWNFEEEVNSTNFSRKKNNDNITNKDHHTKNFDDKEFAYSKLHNKFDQQTIQQQAEVYRQTLNLSILEDALKVGAKPTAIRIEARISLNELGTNIKITEWHNFATQNSRLKLNVDLQIFVKNNKFLYVHGKNGSCAMLELNDRPNQSFDLFRNIVGPDLGRSSSLARLVNLANGDGLPKIGLASLSPTELRLANQDSQPFIELLLVEPETGIEAWKLSPTDAEIKECEWHIQPLAKYFVEPDIIALSIKQSGKVKPSYYLPIHSQLYVQVFTGSENTITSNPINSASIASALKAGHLSLNSASKVDLFEVYENVGDSRVPRNERKEFGLIKDGESKLWSSSSNLAYTTKDDKLYVAKHVEQQQHQLSSSINQNRCKVRYCNSRCRKAEQELVLLGWIDGKIKYRDIGSLEDTESKTDCLLSLPLDWKTLDIMFKPVEISSSLNQEEYNREFVYSNFLKYSCNSKLITTVVQSYIPTKRQNVRGETIFELSRITILSKPLVPKENIRGLTVVIMDIIHNHAISPLQPMKNLTSSQNKWLVREFGVGMAGSRSASPTRMTSQSQLTEDIWRGFSTALSCYGSNNQLTTLSVEYALVDSQNAYSQSIQKTSTSLISENILPNQNSINLALDIWLRDQLDKFFGSGQSWALNERLVSNFEVSPTQSYVRQTMTLFDLNMVSVYFEEHVGEFMKLDSLTKNDSLRHSLKITFISSISKQQCREECHRRWCKVFQFCVSTCQLIDIEDSQLSFLVLPNSSSIESSANKKENRLEDIIPTSIEQISCIWAKNLASFDIETKVRNFYNMTRKTKNSLIEELRGIQRFKQWFDNLSTSESGPTISITRNNNKVTTSKNLDKQQSVDFRVSRVSYVELMDTIINDDEYNQQTNDSSFDTSRNLNLKFELFASDSKLSASSASVHSAAVSGESFELGGITYSLVNVEKERSIGSINEEPLTVSAPYCLEQCRRFGITCDAVSFCPNTATCTLLSRSQPARGQMKIPGGDDAVTILSSNELSSPFQSTNRRKDIFSNDKRIAVDSPVYTPNENTIGAISRRQLGCEIWRKKFLSLFKQSKKIEQHISQLSSPQSTTSVSALSNNSSTVSQQDMLVLLGTGDILPMTKLDCAFACLSETQFMCQAFDFCTGYMQANNITPDDGDNENNEKRANHFVYSCNMYPETSYTFPYPRFDLQVKEHLVSKLMNENPNNLQIQATRCSRYEANPADIMFDEYIGVKRSNGQPLDVNIEGGVRSSSGDCAEVCKNTNKCTAFQECNARPGVCTLFFDSTKAQFLLNSGSQCNFYLRKSTSSQFSQHLLKIEPEDYKNNNNTASTIRTIFMICSGLALFGVLVIALGVLIISNKDSSF